MTSFVLLCLAGEWTGHYWQDTGGAGSNAEEHKARGNCLSDRGSSGGGLSTSRTGKLYFFLKDVTETILCLKTRKQKGRNCCWLRKPLRGNCIRLVWEVFMLAGNFKRYLVLVTLNAIPHNLIFHLQNEPTHRGIL